MDINHISNRTIFRILFSVTAFVGIIYLAYLARRPLLLIGIAIFLALAINPLVDKLTAWMPGRRRGLAVGVTFIGILAAISAVIYLLVPPLVDQTQDLIQDLPQYAERVEESDNLLGRLADRYQIVERIRSGQFGAAGGQASSSVIGVARGAFGGLLTTVAIITLTVFMLLEGPHWSRRFWAVQRPTPERVHRQHLAEQMYRVIAGYVTGRLFLALLAAGVAIIALTLIGIPFAIPLGVLVGVLALVPLVGATLGAAVVVLVALFNSVNQAVVAAIFFLVYQQLENNLLQPMVDSRTVQVSPLTVLMSALIGISLGGLIGALVAIPVVGCLQILARDFLTRHDRLRRPKTTG